MIEPEYGTVEDIKEEKVKKIAQRQLMLLSDFLLNIEPFDTDEKKIPLNIEIKGEKIPGISSSRFLNREIMGEFVELLEAGGATGLMGIDPKENHHSIVPCSFGFRETARQQPFKNREVEKWPN